MMHHGSDELGGDDLSESGAEQDQSSQSRTARQRRKNDAPSKEDGPACQACRRKKAKCSRRQPCSQCVRNATDCVYDEAKNKPGMRVGAVEQLSQRLATLENMFLGQGLVWQQVWRHLEALGDKSSPAPFSSLGTPPGASLQESTAQLRDSLIALGGGDKSDPAATIFDPSRQAKRRRVGDASSQEDIPVGEIKAHSSSSDTVPLPADLIDSLVEIYFERIHPWIPMLHVCRFRQQMADPARRYELSTVFHAITSLCARFSDDERLGEQELREGIMKRSRETVILRSMESFSVKNLQALIICAFDTIASGRGPSAWSIVGSMTRTAEQLQLSVENDEKRRSTGASNGIITRIAFLHPPRDWSEEEERRRVFWNIFLMDRFCSISTGWNLSLTSADARRRLPCEGGLWEAAEPLDTPTPYFGLSDQTNTKDYQISDARPTTQDQNCLGGFAYCIEATESLSQVTSFFLHQARDATQDTQIWLMRFKQLDLRLVQWKVFLPERWREACAVNSDGNMDPNLTLAHITHNTAVVLLHQGIAYPSPEWQATPVRLPSQSSAETCLAAAIEVATISKHFLTNTSILTNHQFAFCLFVCGRMLLAHSAYYHVPLAASFDSLVESLREISKRWNGSSFSSGTSSRNVDLASKFASRLSEAKDTGSMTFDIRQAAYSEDGQGVASRGSERTGQGVHDSFTNSGRNGFAPGDLGTAVNWSDGELNGPLPSETSPDSISLAFPPLPQAFQAPPSANHSRAQTPSLLLNGVYGFNGNASAPAEPSNLAEGSQAVQGFEDISTYLDSTFLPNQRISMYSQLESVGRQYS